MPTTLLIGDCRERLREIAPGSMRACISSPPYWQKRDYEADGQLGLEATPEEFASTLADTFDLVRPALADDGVLWLNIGDSYAAGGNGWGGSLSAKRTQDRTAVNAKRGWRRPPPGYKDKDLTLAPMMVAMALRERGWYLRQTIVLAFAAAIEPKRQDRPSVSHEYLFQLTPNKHSCARDPGEAWWGQSVWTIAKSPGVGDHPAPMSEELVRRCMVCSTSAGDAVLDPFGGAGTVGRVAERHGRDATLIEINPTWADLARTNIRAGRGRVHCTDLAEHQPCLLVSA